ncbi:16S rRNA (cytidine(1402)-2'-O)-methyltransferase [Marinobacteraceae bacterium S3BR75-40.1]
MTQQSEGRDSLGGALIIVATPIGNLGDISHRAEQMLASADLIAAEDTRHSRKLLNHLGLEKPLAALHEFNEEARSGSLLDRVAQGQVVALVSDAGTPLISDPGFHLVREAHRRGLKVTTAPGACAAIAALSVGGLPTDRFVFEGFLPSKEGARRRRLDSLRKEARTLIFYESPHRIDGCLQNLAEVFGEDRQGVVARELTKSYETVYVDALGQLAERAQGDPDMRRGEIVVLVAGAEVDREEAAADLDVERLLVRLLQELPVKKVARVVADVTGLPKNELYQRALALKGE